MKHDLLRRYWGKANPAAGCGLDHHTVLGHSLDVAACAAVLIERHPALSAQVARASELPQAVVAHSFAAVCALHDLGKLDTRFQRKAESIADRLRPESIGALRVPYDHGTEGFRLAEEDEVLSATLVDRVGPSALSLLRAVCGHHGVFPRSDDPDASRSRLLPSLRREDQTARRLLVEVVLDLFRGLGAERPWLRVVSGPLIQQLGGLCAIADWIGSDVSHFPYEPLPNDVATYWHQACERAQAACADAGLIRTLPRGVGFSSLFPGYEPRDVQILTESLAIKGPSLVIVEAEMGKGKTEAALALASRCMGQGLADGVTVALPTMATSNAMFGRVLEVAMRLFSDETAVQLALSHGRSRRVHEFQRLLEHPLRALDPDAPEASVQCARWLLSRKRTLLAQLGVGTIDQALQAALVVPHQFVRMFALSRNIVVIDEVHAYDAYMEVLLEHLLSWLGALGVTVILLSATLPSSRRRTLATAWSGRAASQEIEPLHEAVARPYPLVSVTTPRTSYSVQLPGRGASRTVQLERPAIAGDAPWLASVAVRLVSAARAGARVVWIRNTVREAQQAYRAVAAASRDVEHLLFHARFRGCDRGSIERHVIDRFGKRAPVGGRVLVATQVVEQSLDLDFDELHTDLASIDLLFQRVGRLHRHERLRAAGFERPTLIVHSPTNEDADSLRFGPSKYVYDAGTLWLTNYVLRSRASLTLPDDIRPLVEQIYHPSARASLLPLGGAAALAAERGLEEVLAARRTRAIRCCISKATEDPVGDSSLLDDDEDTTQAFTRDGASSSMLLPFWWDGNGARALDATEGDPTWSLDSKAPDAWRLANLLVDETLSLPARTGVEGIVFSEAEDWERWRQRFARFAEESGLGRKVIPIPLARDGTRHKGWLRMGRARRRVLYDKALGLMMPSETDEEETLR
jgi:CRISPR-associated endonuclease/helicase Cas3